MRLLLQGTGLDYGKGTVGRLSIERNQKITAQRAKKWPEREPNKAIQMLHLKKGCSGASLTVAGQTLSCVAKAGKAAVETDMDEGELSSPIPVLPRYLP